MNCTLGDKQCSSVFISYRAPLPIPHESEKSCRKINNSVAETVPKDSVDILGRPLKWQPREAASDTFLQPQEQQAQPGVQSRVPSASRSPVLVRTVLC